MTTIISTQEIQWLQNPSAQLAGGKASGLHKLLRWGLNVPQGFIITQAQSGDYPEDLADYYEKIGAGNVAVRSSAMGEDGENSSFAGQYESVLNVRGLTALEQAIDTCVLSLQSQRATAYQIDQNTDSEQMNIVVQCMVDACSAGVLFSADPISGRHDRCVIDAVSGLGEALVSGEVTPDHYELSNDSRIVHSELVDNKPILSIAQCQQLHREAQIAVKNAEEPLDLEWAFDQDGRLFWLQARPITTLGSDLNELDTPLNSGDVLTRCNVGEMMPGASCPLTFSTTGRAIEYGMQHMHVSYASRPSVNEQWTQLAMSHGKMFLNLTGAASAAATVLGVDVKSLGQSVCGRIITELQEPKKQALWKRLLGMIKLLNYLKQADSVIAEFRHRTENFELPCNGNSNDIAIALDNAQGFLYEAFCVHLQSSTTSGFASNVIQAIISGGQYSSPEEEAEAARLLAGASNVESAVLVEQLDTVVDAIVSAIENDANIIALFLDVPANAAWDWINSEKSGSIQQAILAFLKRHGHRSYRELCMREVSWADAPENLITTMQASVRAKLKSIRATVKPKAAEIQELNRGLRWILPKAHNAVRRREATKSLLVKITNRFKKGYRALGHQLVTEGKLADADQIFFFTHQELMLFVSYQNAGHIDKTAWLKKLDRRRLALAFQDRLDFAEICVGPPEPLEKYSLDTLTDHREIIGRPVSRGIIEGKARVALSVDEASALKAGEILIAPITDVGWTPYFSMISGLVTDVGSAVSHGAVIAREYGLPAIVNTRIATQYIKTGDHIRLNADTGVIRLLDSELPFERLQ